MSRYIDADTLKIPSEEMVAKMIINSAPHINLDDYVPKEFHDKTCEAMAKAHQEEIANMVSVVRCKECKYRYVDGEQVKFNACELNHNKVQSDDWFCADGERGE